MAVQAIEKSSSKPTEYMCLSTDVKPTNVPIGSGLAELQGDNTTIKYYTTFDGTNWVEL